MESSEWPDEILADESNPPTPNCNMAFFKKEREKKATH